MTERWYKEAVVYCLDVETFYDGNGDGIGDFAGLTSQLDYLARLGVTCLWLNPIHPGPNRDDGYDVTDHYGVDPRLGSLGEFVEFVHQADNRGLRVILDLVVNHTSDQHPWFQAARSDPSSPYRDYYVWSKEKPAQLDEGVVFPGVQDTTWTYDRKAKAWYYHRFYEFQPDLNICNPAVRREIERIMAFWLRLGVSGFRVDAAPFLIEQTGIRQPDRDDQFTYLDEFRSFVQWRRGDAVLLAEANVSPDQLGNYFGGGNRFHMLFAFLLNQQLFLALARHEAKPIVEALHETPGIDPADQWATFLRNHDEVDLGRLGDGERAEVFEAFGPEPAMQLYGRGIRRRLAPMLGFDRRRIELAYALQFSLPGTPVLRYGEELGMGDDLSLPEREAIRTPMQWSGGRNAGFSTAPATALVRPLVSKGPASYRTVNVGAQRRDRNSLLSWFERMLRTLRECPEFGTGTCTVVESGDPGVLALHYRGSQGEVLAVHNLAPTPCTVSLDVGGRPRRSETLEMFADDGYDGGIDLAALALTGYGYRWIRLR